MTIRNYTSTVPVATSVANIEHCLVRAGASNISKSFDIDGNLAAMVFQLRVGQNPMPILFKLPARWQACEAVLWKEVKRPRPETRKRVHEQALRTAWKIVHDWVEIQISMIALEQAEAIEVFLPYAWNPADDRTFFEAMRDGGFQLLTSGGGR